MIFGYNLFCNMFTLEKLKLEVHRTGNATGVLVVHDSNTDESVRVEILGDPAASYNLIKTFFHGISETATIE